MKVVCLFHTLSSPFCLDLCSIGKTHRQYIFLKQRFNYPRVPRDFLYAVSGSVKSLWGPKRKAFFLAKHPAAREKNPLVTRVRTNTTLSQYLVFYWCIWNCLERYREVVGRDWCHMSFGIIAESMLTRYSQNPSQSLGHLRPVTGDDLMFKENSSKLCLMMMMTTIIIKIVIIIINNIER